MLNLVGPAYGALSDRMSTTGGHSGRIFHLHSLLFLSQQKCRPFVSQVPLMSPLSDCVSAERAAELMHRGTLDTPSLGHLGRLAFRSQVQPNLCFGLCSVAQSNQDCFIQWSGRVTPVPCRDDCREARVWRERCGVLQLSGRQAATYDVGRLSNLAATRWEETQD